MATEGSIDIFSISFGWSTILKYLSYIDICNIGALTNQNLTSSILEAIGDKSNQNENKKRNPIMKTSKINEYADRAMMITLSRYVFYFGLKWRPFFKEVYKINGVFAG